MSGYFYVAYGQCKIEQDVWYANIRSYPQLTGSVSPASGTVSTLFNFTANYTHPEYTLPTTIRLNIDGTFYNMAEADASDVDSRDGKIYYVNKTLTAGAHTYYFNTTDYGGKVNATATANGPTVTGTNSVPTLTAGQVAPTLAGTATLFNFTVNYTDSENEPPLDIKVIVDGSAKAMKGISAAYSSGVIYYYNATLQAGTHLFWFNATDGNNTVSTGITNWPNVYSASPPCNGADPSVNPTWNIDQYTNCTNTAILPTSTHAGQLNITGGNILNLTTTQIYLNNTLVNLNGWIIFGNSNLIFVR